MTSDNLEGTKHEGFIYIDTLSDILEWVSDEEIYINEESYIIDKKARTKFFKYLNLSRKLIKLISSDGHDIPIFNKIFNSIIHVQKLNFYFKVMDDKIVGFLEESDNRLTNIDFKEKILPYFNSLMHMERSYLSIENDVTSLVIEDTSIDDIMFCGVGWRSGIIFTYSSIANKPMQIMPCLIPNRSNFSFYSLPMAHKDLIMTPDVQMLQQESYIKGAAELSQCVHEVINKWNVLSSIKLSVAEYEAFNRKMFFDKTSNAENDLKDHLIEIKDLLGMESKTPKKVKVSAHTEVTIELLFTKIVNMSLPYEFCSKPNFFLGEKLDQESFDLKANTSVKTEELQKLITNVFN